MQSTKRLSTVSNIDTDKESPKMNDKLKDKESNRRRSQSLIRRSVITIDEEDSSTSKKARQKLE
jgi:hypothetical protein